MKATINGITVEGTPEEIVKYEQLRHEENMKNTKYITVDTIKVEDNDKLEKWLKNLQRSEVTATY